MKYLVITLAILGFVATWADAEDVKKEISWNDLNGRVKVIGKLGCQLGNVVEIEGIIVAGSELKRKDLQSEYLIRVDKVDGKLLSSAPTMRFHVRSFHGVSLASDAFSLYKLKKGKKAGQLSDNDIRELEKGYVGKQVRLLVWEQGCFGGIPSNMPPGAIYWQDHGFSFQTQLLILKDLTQY